MNLDRARVVILNYNQPMITAQCVSNVLQQSYQPLDVVVVDNGSSAENFLELQRLLDGQRVILIRQATNSGYAAGNNAGARLSDGVPRSTFTLISNNDVFFRGRDSIEELIQAIKRDPRVVAVSPLVHNSALADTPPEAQNQVRRDTHYVSLLVSGSWWLRRLPCLKRIAEQHVYQDVRPYQLNRVYECHSINGAFFLIRTDFLEEIGYLDEGTYLYYEELVLGRQIKLKDRTCGLVTSVVVDHHQGTTSGQQHGYISVKVFRQMLASELYYCRKYLHAGWAGQSLLVLVRAVDFITRRIGGLVC